MVMYDLETRIENVREDEVHHSSNWSNMICKPVWPTAYFSDWRPDVVCPLLDLHRNEFDAAETATSVEEDSPTHLLQSQELTRQSGWPEDFEDVSGLLVTAQVSLAETFDEQTQDRYRVSSSHAHTQFMNRVKNYVNHWLTVEKIYLM